MLDFKGVLVNPRCRKKKLLQIPKKLSPFCAIFFRGNSLSLVKVDTDRMDILIICIYIYV